MTCGAPITNGSSTYTLGTPVLAGIFNMQEGMWLLVHVLLSCAVV